MALQTVSPRFTEQSKGARTMEKKRMPETPTDLSGDAVVEISRELRKLLADVFTLYLKTKNFHWHMSGPHFRDYHLLLDDQGDQIFAMTDEIGNAPARSAGSPFDPLARSRACSASQITTRNLSLVKIC